MFERYEEHAKRSIFFAKIEAREHDCAYIEVEHLLIGILREVPQIFEVMTSTPAASLRQDVWKILQERQQQREAASPTLGGEVPLSAELIRVIEHAAEVADREAQAKINPLHLLMAMFMEKGSAVSELLEKNGVTPSMLHSPYGWELAVKKVPNPPPQMKKTSNPPPPINVSHYGVQVGPEILFVLQDGRRISSTVTLDYVPRLKERVRLSLDRGYTSEFTVVDVRYDYKLVNLTDGNSIQRLKTVVLYLKPCHGRDEEEYSSLT